MTEIQKKLVEDNINLAYHCAHAFDNTPIEFEERVAISFLGLVKAARIYDPEKGTTFATLAMRVMRNDILMELRYVRKYYGTLSLDYPYEDNHGRTLSDNVVDKVPHITNVENMLDFETFLANYEKRIKGKRKELLNILIDEPGMTQHYYSERIGLSQPVISRYMIEIRKEYLK